MKPLLLCACLFVLLAGCTSHAIVVPYSEQVILVTQGATVQAPWDAALLSRGRYLQLVEAEMYWIASGRPKP